MKKEYIISGLDCQNCANKLMEKAKKEECISKIDINYVMGKMKLETTDEKKALIFLKKEEKSLVITKDNNLEHNHSHSHDHHENEGKKLIIKLILSLLLIILSFLVTDKLSNIILIITYIIIGYEVIYKAIHNLLKGNLFDEFFLMFIATFAALMIGEYIEAVIVMYFYMLGEYLQSLAIDNSRKSIRNLLESQIKEVNVKGKGLIDPKKLEVGDLIELNAGDKIPVDAIALEDIYMNTSALTGESIPKKYLKDETVLASMILDNKSSKFKVIKDYDNSTISKMIKLVEDANDNKSKTEQFITKFSKIYTPIVVLLAFLLVLILPFFGFTYDEAIYRAVILLVISCPCALVISVPLGYFTTIGKSTSQGILIKGATIVDSINKVDTIIMDKTGTLTKGNFVINNYKNYSNLSDEKIFNLLASAEKKSTHPISKSIISFYEENYKEKLLDFDVEEVKGKGLKFYFEKQEILIGKKDFIIDNDIKLFENDFDGTIVYMSIDKKHSLTIDIQDQIKEESKDVIESLKNSNIKQIIMLTGDNKKTAEKVSKKLNIKEFYYNLLPEDKLRILKSKKSKDTTIAFIGDGINDAPVISAADVGISMGKIGSDVTIESSDVVINNDSLESLIKLKRTSKKGIKIIKQNLFFAIIIKVVFILLGILGIATMFEAIFSDVGVTIIAILNTLRILKD